MVWVMAFSGEAYPLWCGWRTKYQPSPDAAWQKDLETKSFSIDMHMRKRNAA
jgi:hypothetical protein